MADGTLTEAVRAARSGDQKALDRLVADHLPLIYNIVGRALEVPGDVDDVVQDIMLQMVRDLRALRDPAAFRSWLVAIAMRQVRRHGRVRRSVPPADGSMEMAELADPGADFVDLTITSLHLSGQRREVAEATRWLEADDRQLLALWWLETAGELSRGEVADALGLSQAQAAVRIQRMKAQLETARAVVRAVTTFSACPSLGQTMRGWDGRPSGLWRKRIARHVRECFHCGGMPADMIPAERLLADLALVPIPIALAAIAGKGGVAASAAAAWLMPSRWWGTARTLSSGKAVVVSVAAAVVAGTAVAAYKPTKAPAAITPGRTTGATPLPSRSRPAVTAKAPADTRFPIRAAFYYPWYAAGAAGHGQSYYMPSAGYYNMDEPATIDRQIKDMQYAGLQAGIASWWGQGLREDKRMPLLMSSAARLRFSWTVYYEKEGYADPSIGEIKSDLVYLRRYSDQRTWLHIDGKPVIFVFADNNDACAMATRWKKANQTTGYYVVLKVFGGYRGCPDQPSSWHQYGASLDIQPGYSAIASPGFWKYDEKKPRIPRDPAAFRKDVTTVARSKAPFQLIISYNEWGEGTAFESGTQWPSDTGHGIYSDILHQVFSAYPR